MNTLPHCMNVPWPTHHVDLSVAQTPNPLDSCFPTEAQDFDYHAVATFLLDDCHVKLQGTYNLESKAILGAEGSSRAMACTFAVLSTTGRFPCTAVVTSMKHFTINHGKNVGVCMISRTSSSETSPVVQDSDMMSEEG